jgi:putative heme transporter
VTGERTSTGPGFPRPSLRQALQGVGGLVIAVGLLGWGLPHFAGTSWHRVFRVLEHVGPLTAVGLLFIMMAGLWLYTFTLTGSLPGLSHPRALIVNVCGSSVGNLLPGGGAAGVAATYAMCRSWGFSRRDISTSVVVSGVWNVLARVTLPVIGIGALVLGAGDLPKAVARGGIIGGAVGLLLLGLFVAVIVSGGAATAIGRTLDTMLRPLWRRRQQRHELSIDDLVRDLRARITGVVRTGWASMTFGLVGFFGVYYVLFWFCLNAVGVHVSFAHMFAAYALGRLLTAVGITPGGVGVTETGTAAVLVGWGADPAAATAGVVLFSLYTHLMEIPLGAVGWLAWGLSRKRRPADA